MREENGAVLGRHLPAVRHAGAGRAAAGHRAGGAPGPGAAGGDRRLHQAAAGRRRRHAAVAGERERRRARCSTRTNDDLDLTAAAEDASIIRFVNQVLAEAIELRATDVHFEPFENQLRVRYRIDGVLQEANIPGEVRRFQAAIVSRLKILSHLDIAEKRLPQDGRIS